MKAIRGDFAFRSSIGGLGKKPSEMKALEQVRRSPQPLLEQLTLIQREFVPNVRVDQFFFSDLDLFKVLIAGRIAVLGSVCRYRHNMDSPLIKRDV